MITNLTSKTLMIQFKSIFAEYGIPKTTISDGGTQYTSQEFQDFTRLWQIEHFRTSPRNSQSNGLAESFLHTVTNTLLKTAQMGEDPDLALLAYKTTPLSHSLPSLAEFLNSRKIQDNCTHLCTKSNMSRHGKDLSRNAEMKPGSNRLLQPNSKRTTQPTYYTRHLCATLPHKEQMDNSNNHRNNPNRSYKVKITDGGENIQNRKFIKPRHCM